jgi:DNA invertase Pin-like site-specific DNA recombinase
MIAAVYGRKSTEQNDIADEAKSVARQVEHARAYAQRKGWTVADEHVYADDGVSGALFGAARPGLARLLNALSPRPSFQALVMSEESRLGRETIETGYTLKQITDAGVRVFFYLEDRERTLDTAMDKVMLSLTNFASEMEREKTRQRTHDALLRKARAGHVAGGSVYGYRNIPVMDGERRSHTEREVDPAEASVIRRIFELAAGGMGYQRIAHTLNEEGVTAPLPRRAGRPRGWAPSTIRAMLFRELYRGVIVWNQTERVIRRGGHRKRQRATEHWLRLEAPSARIIPETLWAATHQRLAGTRASYLGVRNGHAGGRPVNGSEGRYLLTGLGECGCCGGGMFVHTHGARYPASYGCMSYHTRGRVVCKNSLEVPLLATDSAVLSAVEHDLLRVEVLETALAKALDMLRPAPDDAGESRGHRIREELTRLEAEVGRLASAIAVGGDLSALLTALREREQRRARLLVDLASGERPRPGRNGLDLRRVLGDLREKLADWQGLLRQEAPEARRALSALLAGRLIFTPHGEGRERYYEFAGPGNLGKVVSGLALPTELVPRDGSEAVYTRKIKRLARAA